MAESLDITGQKFNSLLAVKRTGKDGIWLFRCDCGNEKEIPKGNVVKTKNGVKSCGCLRGRRKRGNLAENIKGRRFNSLVAVRYDEASSIKHNTTCWLFKCDCGNEKVLRLTNVNGKTKSCGCFRKERIRYDDITGQKFNRLTAISFVEVKNEATYWNCLCQCGRKTITRASALKNGTTKSCGCLQLEARHLTSGKNHPRWKANRRFKNYGGYISVRINNRDDERHGKILLEHRLVMEQILNRRLLPNENVHHRNGVKTDNRPENLELWATSQPKGQRVQDLIAHALEILKAFSPERLK